MTRCCWTPNITLRPALETIAKHGPVVRFHAPNALHVGRFQKTGAILLHGGFTTIRLGLLATGTAKTAASGAAKVNTRMYLKAVENLFEAGFSADDIGVYLLCGCAGLNPGRSLRVHPTLSGKAGSSRTSPTLPHSRGTAMWEHVVAISPFDIRMERLYTKYLFCLLLPRDFYLMKICYR